MTAPIDTPQHVVEVVQALVDGFDPLLFLNPHGLLRAYLDTNPLLSALGLCLTFALYSFVVSTITGNYSSVDRLWSVVPAYYVLHFAMLGNGGPRVIVMTILAVLWAVRLTYNFYRKGGFSGEEDYRWPELRRIINNKWIFMIFNLTFISTYQHLLLLAFTLPAYVCASVGGAQPWAATDSAATLLFSALLLLETAADQQQWVFQQQKAALKHAKAALMGDFKLGFLTHGLFRFSRHPNFFAEASMWWSFYLFSVGATGVWLNWSLAGTALLTLLFQARCWLSARWFAVVFTLLLACVQGSTDFTESLTKGRYPDYARYQETTSRLVPWLPGPAVAAHQ